VETDPSCTRLLQEILVTLTTNDPEEGESYQQHEQKAKEIVRELCHQTAETCKELQHMEHRLGKYQKFSWDVAGNTSGSGKKKKRKKGSSGGGSVDKIEVEWHNEDKLCSLIYFAKKRKSSHGSASKSATEEEKQGDEATTNQNKPKPFVVKINAVHYHKLQAMFDSTYSSISTSASMSKDQATHAFHAALFAMVIRYSSLSGGQLLNDWRGGGMQGAVHDGVFDCLSKWFGASLSDSGTECFASPFNSTIPKYYSAFSADVDGHFGSYGDFFYPSSDSEFVHSGWLELNPPFSPGMMTKMANRIVKLLGAQCKQELDAAFVVIIPSVRSLGADSKARKKKQKKRDRESKQESNTQLMSIINGAASQSFNQLVNSPYCRSHTILKPREHGYIEGGQHLRPTKFKESQYSTSVIVLKTKDWKNSEDAKLFEKDLREAFASRHAMEVEQRRQNTKERYLFKEALRTLACTQSTEDVTPTPVL